MQLEFAHRNGGGRWVRHLTPSRCLQSVLRPYRRQELGSDPGLRPVGDLQTMPRHFGGSGSLDLAPSFKDTHERPFVIGSLGLEPGHVYILDEHTLPLVLQHFGTVSDFIAYLEFKEALFRSAKVGTIAGEENLLALFLSNFVRSGLGYTSACDPAAHVFP